MQMSTQKCTIKAGSFETDGCIWVGCITTLGDLLLFASKSWAIIPLIYTWTGCSSSTRHSFLLHRRNLYFYMPTCFCRCLWMRQGHKSLFLSWSCFSFVPPHAAQSEQAAVSEDENVRPSSRFHISRCSARAKLRVVAAQFHHSHLFWFVYLPGCYSLTQNNMNFAQGLASNAFTQHLNMKVLFLEDPFPKVKASSCCYL